MAEYDLKLKVKTKDEVGADLDPADHEHLYDAVSNVLKNLWKIEDVTFAGKSPFSKSK